MTFESLLTTEGLVGAAALITAIVELLKNVVPGLGERVSGALQAFILSAILYILTALAVGVPTANAGLAIFTSWLAVATAAVGIHSTISHAVKANKSNG